jgi:hypothetical protein
MEKLYIIFNTSEINLINFTQILESSAETLRMSRDGFKAIIKWEGNTPDFIDILTTKEGPYTHEEISNIVLAEEWQPIN